MTENKKPVLSIDDVNNIENFFLHFKIELPQALKEEIETFTKDPEAYSIIEQDKLKAALSHAMISSNHKVFSNPVWKGTLSNCDEAYYNAQFDKDLEEALEEED